MMLDLHYIRWSGDIIHGHRFEDYEINGLLDIVTTGFSDDYKVLYHNVGNANFSDMSYRAASPSRIFRSWDGK